MRSTSWFVLTLALSGCGGGGETVTSPATPPPELKNCQIFPAGLVPFVRVHSTINGTTGSDRMVVGELAPGVLDRIRTQLPLPRSPAEQYCDPVPLGPGLTVRAFVLTQAEKDGDYSQFSGAIADPLSGSPFPGNIVPPERLSGAFAWHVPAS